MSSPTPAARQRSNPGRADTLLQEAGVVHDQDRVRVAEMLHDVITEVIEDLLGVPVAPIQQPVHPIRSRVTGLFGQRPAVLPLQRSDQSPHIRQRRLPRLRPREPVHEPLMQLAQARRPRPDIIKFPTHSQTNDSPGHQSRQTPLQY